MTLKRPEETYVRSDTQLTDLWRGLMGSAGFELRSLWLIFFYPDGRLSPVISPIDDVSDDPDPLRLGNLERIVADVTAEFGGTAAFLLARPGSGQMTAGDRRWARMVRAAVPVELSPWPMHLATRDHVRVFAPDDLIA